MQDEGGKNRVQDEGRELLYKGSVDVYHRETHLQ